MSDTAATARPDVGAVRTVYDVAMAADLEYSPDLDGLADPGEIVWAWVPYEEDRSIGKDRPLLVVGRNAGNRTRGAELLAMMLSSNEERADDPDWHPVGAGRWDRSGRESFLRLDRIFALGEDDIRREGAVLDPEAFVHVTVEIRKRYGWARFD